MSGLVQYCVDLQAETEVVGCGALQQSGPDGTGSCSSALRVAALSLS